MTDSLNVGEAQAEEPKPEVGSTEHDKEMIAKVDEAAGETTDRPEWLPEKFKSVEDMAKAYESLEKKLGQPTGEEAEEAPQSAEETPTTEEETPSVDDVQDLLSSKDIDFDTLQAEYNENKGLSDETFKQLEESGLPKPLVESWIAGQEALAADFEATIYDGVGGQEAYGEMIGWAKDNLSEAESKAFDKAVTSGDLGAAQLAVSGLQGKYQAASGVDPSLLAQGQSRGDAGGVYSSWAEVTRDMSDPRYNTDSAYRAKVSNKLSRSDVK